MNGRMTTAPGAAARGGRSAMAATPKAAAGRDCPAVAWLRVAWCATAMGVVLGGFWGARFLSATFGSLYLPTVRMGAVAFLVLVAFVCRRRPVGLKAAVVGMAALLCVQVGALPFVRGGLAAPELAAVGFVAGCAQGAFLALGQCTALVYATHLDARSGALAVALAYLVANLVDAAFVLGGSLGAPVLLCACQGVAVALLAMPMVVPAISSTSDGSQDRAVAPTETAAETFKAVFGPSFAVFLLFAAALLCIQGGFAQISQLGGYGDGGGYGVWTEILALWLRVVVVLVCALGAARFKAGTIMTFVVPIWVLGLCVSVLGYGSGGVMAAGFILKAGLYVLQVLALVLAVQLAHRQRVARGFVVGLVAALVLVGQVCGLAVYGAWGDRAITFELVAGFAVVSLAAIVIVHVATYALPFFGSRLARTAQRVSSAAIEEAPGADEEGSCEEEADPLVREHMQFYERFCVFCGENDLTNRERQVLYEALRGYTADNIGVRLGLSTVTVKTYLHRIYTRAGVSGKQDVLEAIEKGPRLP